MKKTALITLLAAFSFYACDESELDQIESLSESNSSETELQEIGIQVGETEIQDLYETGISSDKYGPVATNLSSSMSAQNLTWQSNASSGVSNSGRDLHGVNTAGSQPLAYFINEEVEDGPNGEAISMTFDYDLSQNVTTGSGFGTSNTAAFNFHLQGGGGGYSNSVRPISMVLYRNYQSSSVEIYGWVVSANNYNSDVYFSTTIPLQGTIEVTSSDIKVNGNSLFTQSVHVPFTYLKVTLSQDVDVSDIDLTGFGEVANNNPANSVYAVYSTTIDNNFAGLVEGTDVTIEYNSPILSSTVNVTLRRRSSSQVLASSFGEANDGVITGFTLPNIPFSSNDYYIRVSGAGKAATSQDFTILKMPTLMGGS